MDDDRVDMNARAVARGGPRRRLLRSLVGAAIGGLHAAPAIAASRPRANDPADESDRDRAGDGAGSAERSGCARLNKQCGQKKCCGVLSCKGGKCRCQGKTKPCKGKCIPKGDCCTPADCDGRACADGICQPCLPGFKLCFLSCIPEDQCCNCNPPKTCQAGACVCPSGTTPCGSGGCRANGADGCCADGDCGGGETCQNGTCRCPSGQASIGGVCRATCQFSPVSQCGSSGCVCSETVDGPNVCIALDSIDCLNRTCDDSAECDPNEVCVTLFGCPGPARDHCVRQC
jgi:hypothetical protein